MGKIIPWESFIFRFILTPHNTRLILPVQYLFGLQIPNRFHEESSLRYFEH